MFTAYVGVRRGVRSVANDKQFDGGSRNSIGPEFASTTKPHRPNGQGGIRVFRVISTETASARKPVRFWGLTSAPHGLVAASLSRSQPARSTVLSPRVCATCIYSTTPSAVPRRLSTGTQYTLFLVIRNLWPTEALWLRGSWIYVLPKDKRY